MKLLKKGLSFLLTGVIAISSLFFGTISAAAEGTGINTETKNLIDEAKESTKTTLKGVKCYYKISDKEIDVFIEGLPETKMYNFWKKKADRGMSFNIALSLNNTMLWYRGRKATDFKNYFDPLTNYNRIVATGKKMELNIMDGNLYNKEYLLSTDDLYKRPILPSDEYYHTQYSDFAKWYSENPTDSSDYTFVYRIRKNNTIYSDLLSNLKKTKKVYLSIWNVDSTDRYYYYGDKKWYQTSFSGNADPNDVSNFTTKKIAAKQYTGKAIKPSVTVMNGSTVLKSGTDYTLSYKNNVNIGRATVTVKGKGKYSGTLTTSFNIIPKKTVMKITHDSKKTTISWKESKNVDKYQIQVSGDGGITFSDFETVSGTKTELIYRDFSFYKGMLFRIRSYKNVLGKIYYSPFSDVVKA